MAKSIIMMIDGSWDLTWIGSKVKQSLSGENGGAVGLMCS